MKTTLILAALVSLAYGNTSPGLPAHPCKAYPTKVPKLYSCSTSSAFCRNFLNGGPATFTRTSTTTQVAQQASTSYISTSIVTVYVYTDTVTATAGTSTVFGVSTTTSTTTTTTCSTSNLDKRTAARLPNTSCGLGKHANHAEVNGACNCILASSTVVTVSKTPVVSATSTTTTTISTHSTTTSTPISTSYTSTSTYVTTATQEYCAAPTLCGNQGVQWAVYPNYEGPNNDIYYSNFDPEDFKQESPYHTSTTSTIGGINEYASSVSVYNDPYTFPGDYFTLNHRGYIFAQQTGVYTFSTSQVDDIVLLWLGPNAYSGWTRDNADLVVAYQAQSGSATYYLQAGQELAVRIMFGQAQEAAVFFMTVTAPDGTVILDSNTPNSPYLVQFGCNNDPNAPQYQPFGQET